MNKNIKIFFNYFLGPVLFLWLCYSIYSQLTRQPDLDAKWTVIRHSLTSPAIANLVMVVFLMMANWGIEAAKWRLSVRQIQRISLVTAFKAILSGTSFSATTPNRVGEYLGRVLYMNEGNRLKAVALTIAGSMSQLIITLVAGSIGLLLLKDKIVAAGKLSDIWIRIILYGSSLVAVILTVFYFRLSWLTRLTKWVPVFRKYGWLTEGLEGFNATLMLQLLSLSAIRYGVFLLQYYLLFRLYHVEISWWQGWWAVSVSFLALAIFPTIALFTDLGLRGEVNNQLVGLFSSNTLGISLTSFSVWIINLIIPALAGSLLILSIKKIFKNNEENRT